MNYGIATPDSKTSARAINAAASRYNVKSSHAAWLRSRGALAIDIIVAEAETKAAWVRYEAERARWNAIARAAGGAA